MGIKVDRFNALPLSAGEVDVWLMDTRTAFPSEKLPALQALLSQDECEQLVHFRNTADRDHFVLTRAFVRTTLSRYINIAAGHLQFSSNLYGKPAVANQNTMARNISFNISHTTGLITLVIADQRDVGIDAEHPSRSIDLDVSDYYFSVAERDAMRKLPLSLQKDRFLGIWALKESYIKARGMGLAIPLDQFGFRWNDQLGPECIEFADGLDDDPSRWQFWYWRPPAERHHFALCVEARPGTSPAVVVRQTDLMGMEKELGRYPLGPAMSED